MRPELPTGTVTFVFTDVEGSTSVLNELGAERYAEALAAHRAVIRESCTERGGTEVDTQGDAFFFAFPTAPDALAAASNFTGRLAAKGPIRVRVGVHTGTPVVEDEGYVGEDVHRAARIAAVGHGGQVLVSATTASLVDVDLTDLGEHRLKDLAAPERVYQLGDAEFPALKSLYRTNLPAPTTPFLGRERELRDVVELLTTEEIRVVTLTGPGGSGKTRLSVQAAAQASDAFSDGVFWVPLARLRDGSAVEEAFARALDVTERPGRSLADAIERRLVDKRLLVVVDNCEHLIDAVAALVSRLTAACPIVVVASSRERLGLSAERVYDVPPMDEGDAAKLFVFRAKAARSDFRPDENVAEICRALDRLPLAIELAAARVRSLSPEAIRGKLGQRLELLASRGRDVDERQRTLEATIAWSYDLLDEDEQRILRAFSVFAGGCTLAAAEAVAQADLDSIESLLDKSLIRHRTDEIGDDRYWMLETIREYTQRELERLGEAVEVGARHTAFFLEAAAGLRSPVLTAVSDERQHRFRCDRANYWEAISRVLTAGDGRSAQRFVRHLGRVMSVMERPKALYEMECASLALHGGEDGDRAHALVRAATTADMLGEYEHARELLSEAEGLFEVLGDARGTADAVGWRADVEARVGDFASAVALSERLTALGASLGDADIVRRGEDLLSYALLGRAIVDGDQEAAVRSLSLTVAELEHRATVGDSSFELANAETNVAWSMYACGDFANGLRTAQHGLDGFRESDAAWTADSLDLIGLLAYEHGRPGSAATLLAAAESRHEDEGIPREPWLQQLLDRVHRSARAALGDGKYAAAVRTGESLSREQAIELALSITPNASREAT